MKHWIVIHPQDNVAVALADLQAGLLIEREHQPAFALAEAIDKGHKFSLTAIALGEQVSKYGASIGKAKVPIAQGAWVHSHNMVTTLDDRAGYQYVRELTDWAEQAKRTVNVYHRDNGDVGIRNELWVIPSVGCVNGIAQRIVNAFLAENNKLEIDGVFHFPHQFGCSQLGDDHLMTQRLLQQMAQHPNAGGVLVLGLGCENNQIADFKQGIAQNRSERIRYLVSQEADDEVEAGVQLLHELYQTMRHDQRKPGSLADIKVGLECGGSDGLSGITANPLIGRFSDFIVRQGGSTVLTEVPEMFGAEQLLMNRCADQQTFDRVVDLITAFKGYYKAHNQPIYENPSPGNKQGGITTLEEKSLGCTQKSGTSAVVDVLNYAERIHKSGLSLLNAPGNDAIATSALAAAGCHLVLFSTGRGTPYGGFVPTFKIATNSELAKRKAHWIDFDAGRLAVDQTFAQALPEFIDSLIQVINGKPTCNENNQIREIAIWKNGVTL